MAKKLLNEEVSVTLNGEEFRKRRQAVHKTLVDIADSAGISVSYLCDIENGHRTARDEVAKNIVKALEQ